MRQWKAVSTPGGNHKKLEFFAGKWATESRMCAMSPGTEPTVTKGSSENTMVLGGPEAKVIEITYTRMK